MNRTCEACNSNYYTKNSKSFLCPSCAKTAFRDKICPFCGDKIQRPNKPTCKNCAQLYGGTKKGDSVRCQTVMGNGRRCRNWAMIGSYYCKQHQGK